MDLKLLKMLCKDSKQHHVIFHELYSVSSLLCIAQNVRFEIPYKDLYFETPFLMIFKYYAWASYSLILTHSSPRTYPKYPAQTFESGGKSVSAYDLHKLPTQRHLRNAVFVANFNSRVLSGLFGTRETRAKCTK